MLRDYGPVLPVAAVWFLSNLAHDVQPSMFVLYTDYRYGWDPRTVGLVLAFVGVWIEKGMGLIVPGFIPSTLHEMVEYLPNAIEWKVSLGIGALVLMVFTLGLKIAVAVMSGSMHVERPNS